MKKELLTVTVIIIMTSRLAAQTILGIDVYDGTGSINWTQVKSSGKVYAFVKATEGKSCPQSDFSTNMTGGYSANVAMGSFHFALPEDNSAVDEANFFLSKASSYIKAGYLPPVLDLEDPTNDGCAHNFTPLANFFTSSSLTAWVQTWMTTVQNATGIAPILYTDGSLAGYLSSSLSSYKLWIADPDGSATTPPKNIGVWTTWAFKQYSWSGSVSGISKAVDLDVFNGSITDFNNLVGGGCPPSTPTITYGATSCPGTIGSSSYPPGTSLTWDASSNASSYLVNVSKYPYGSSNLLSGYNPFPCSALSSSSASLTLSAVLQPGMLYRWNMYATGDCNSSTCQSGISGTGYFQVPPAITGNNVVNNAVAICAGESETLSLSPIPSPGSGATMTFQWFLNGNTIPAASSSSYTIPMTQQAGSYSYTCEIIYSGSTASGSCGSAAVSSAPSNAITVTIDAAFTPTISITSDKTTICNGVQVTFTASQTNGGISPTYQWYLDNSPIPGATGSTYSSSSLNNDDQIYCIMSSDADCVTSTTATSNTISVTVNPIPPPPGHISGEMHPPINIPEMYSIDPVAYATSYKWYVDAVEEQDQATTSFPWTWTTAGTHTISVTASNDCGSSTSESSITVNVVTGIDEVADQYSITIHPNPSNGNFTISLNNPYHDRMTITLINAEGLAVLNIYDGIVKKTFTKEVDASQLPDGIYMIQFRRGSETFQKKIIIQH